MDLEGGSLWERIKFFCVQEPLWLPWCQGTWSGTALGITNPYSLSALMYFPHCLLDPPCPGACLSVLLLRTSVWKKKKNFTELPAMALIEILNSLRWVIGPVATHEICAVGDRPRVDLGVHSTFAEVLHCPEPDVCRCCMWYRLVLVLLIAGSL